MKTGSQKHLLHLAGFAGATLQILQVDAENGDDPEWSRELRAADTLEKIASAAKDWQLA